MAVLMKYYFNEFLQPIDPQEIILNDSSALKDIFYVAKSFNENEHLRDEKGRFRFGGGYTHNKRSELKENLKAYIGQNIKNKHTGVTAYLSNSSINKISSEKAIEKTKANGFTVDDHFYVANNIVELFKNATNMQIFNDKNKSNDILSIKRFSSNIVLQNKEQATAYITVKEAKIHGHKIYSVEVMEIKKALLVKGLGSAIRKSNVTDTLGGCPTPTLIISQNTEKSRDFELKDNTKDIFYIAKSFKENEHPRDEKGRFTEAGATSIIETPVENLLNTQDLKKYIFSYARQHFQGKKFINKNTKEEIHITRNGLDEWYSKTKSREQIMSLKIIDKLLQEAKFDIATTDNKNRRDIEKIHYYSCQCKINNKEFNAKITVRITTRNESRYYHHFLQDIKIEPNSSTLVPAENQRAPLLLSDSTNSISQNTEKSRGLLKNNSGGKNETTN